MKQSIAVTAACAVLLLPTMAIAADNPAQGITLSQQSRDQWRASKLVGVTIYGPDNKAVGHITDVLMNHDGGAQDIIVGVGGFLGIGEKDVAIPFAAVNFSNKPMPIANAAPANNLAATSSAPAPGSAATSPGTPPPGATMATPTPGIGTPADTLGTVSNPPMGSGGAAGLASLPSTAYPYYGTIAFTADQLKSAPAFKFAP